jgi:hypothetical protein
VRLFTSNWKNERQRFDEIELFGGTYGEYVCDYVNRTPNGNLSDAPILRFLWGATKSVSLASGCPG